VKRWHLPSLAPSSEKRRAREPGADAPRVPSLGRQKPRVLFSSTECRVVVIDLQSGEQLGDHQVRERAVLEVVAGRASVECSGETVECEAGTLVTFDPGELHSVRALADTRLLLLLAPWLAVRDSTEAEVAQAQHLPANASADPMEV
jgi:quercetin dioxygenase-like cupin family protein